MIDAAIVGLGRWGRLLIDSLDGGSEVLRFVRAVARTPAAAADYAAAKGLALGDDYRAALDDPAVQAVVLATPHSLHVPQIVAAAEAGKHVFCEKPLALTSAEARRAVAAVEAAGVCLGIGHNRRFAPNARALGEAIAEGRLGTPLHVEGNFSADMSAAADTWRSDARESPGGFLTSLGIHAIDAMIDFIGPIASVTVKSKRQALSYGIDDTTAMLMEFAGGCTGYLGMVGATAHLYRICVIGTGGWAEIVELDGYRSVLTDGSRSDRRWKGYDYPGLRSMRDGLEAFAAAASGGPAFPVTAGEMVHAVEVLEAVDASATGGGEPRPV